MDKNWNTGLADSLNPVAYGPHSSGLAKNDVVGGEPGKNLHSNLLQSCCSIALPY